MMRNRSRAGCPGPTESPAGQPATLSVKVHITFERGVSGPPTPPAETVLGDSAAAEKTTTKRIRINEPAVLVRIHPPEDRAEGAPLAVPVGPKRGARSRVRGGL